MSARALVPALVALAAPSVACAQPGGTGIFFGTTVGAGVAHNAHPQVPPGMAGGVVWDVVFGWQVAPAWAVAAMLTSWQTSPLGTPWHLHTFAPRVEWGFGPGRRVFLAAALGLGMTDGDVRKRAGLGASLSAGWRVALASWVTLAGEAGVLAHLYDDGHAVQPFLGLHLRFHGRSAP